MNIFIEDFHSAIVATLVLYCEMRIKVTFTIWQHIVHINLPNWVRAWCVFRFASTIREGVTSISSSIQRLLFQFRLFHPISTIQRWTFHFHAPKFFFYVFVRVLCRLHSFRLSLAPKNDGLVVCACNDAPAIPTMICDFNYTQILCTVKVLLL